MKKSLILIILGIILSCGDSTRDVTAQLKKQTMRYHADETDYKKDGMVLRTADSEPLTGLVYWKYNNGQMAYERNYRDGLLHGTSSSWHENGQLSSVGHFMNDELHGTVRAWDINANLEYERQYEKGVCTAGCE